MHIAEAETEEKKMLPPYTDAERSYYREAERTGLKNYQTEEDPA